MTQTVRDLMTTGPVRLEASSSAQDAARAMRENDIGTVLVEADGVPCGIVTDRDLVVRCMADGADASERPLSQLCSEELVSLEAESAVDEAIELMKRKAVRRLPVLEDGSAIGIVSLGDLAQARDRQSVLGEVSAAPANR